MNTAQIRKLLDIAEAEADFPLVAICNAALAGSAEDGELVGFILSELRFKADRCPHCGEADYLVRTAHGEPCCRFEAEIQEGADALASTEHDHSDAWMREALLLVGGDAL